MATDLREIASYIMEAKSVDDGVKILEGLIEDIKEGTYVDMTVSEFQGGYSSVQQVEFELDFPTVHDGIVEYEWDADNRAHLNSYGQSIPDGVDGKFKSGQFVVGHEE